MAANPDDLSTFLREGFATYPAAFDVVDRFEKEVLGAIASAFESKESWKGFRPPASEKEWRTAQKNPRSSRGISAWVPCAPRDGGDNGYLTLGLTWNTPKIGPNAVVAYVHYWVTRTRPIAPAAELRDRVQFGPLEKNDYRLYIVVDDGFDLAEAFAVLLDAIDGGAAELAMQPGG